MSVDEIRPVTPQMATKLVVAHHYLHRRPPISYAYGAYSAGNLQGVVTFGVPPSRHLQMSACPQRPDVVLELNRLWIDDSQPGNSESWFVSRALRLLPARIIVSYADLAHGHQGFIYRALNFYYAGWTDMERKTPRFDYVPIRPGVHSRDAFRNGFASRQRRVAKVKYWTVTGNRTERRNLLTIAGWPRHDWRVMPPPAVAVSETTEPTTTKDGP